MVVIHKQARHGGLALIGSIVACLAVTVAALAQPAPPEKQVVRFASVDPVTLDPAKATGVPEFTAIVNLFEGLTRLGPDDQPVPAAAESWTVSADGLTYTFTLREAKWSNGEPVTAQDFEYAWKRALAPKTACEYAFQLFYLKNAAAYNAGKLKDEAQVGVKALDDRQLRVELREPLPYFLSLVTFPTFMPVPSHLVKASKNDWTATPESLVSNGAFKLVQRDKSRLESVKNPLYWNAGSVRIERLVQVNTDSSGQEASLFDAGELDLLDNFPGEQYAKWAEDPGFKLEPYAGTYYFFLNCRRPQLKDKRVRQAILLGLDRERLISLVGEQQRPASALVPKGFSELSPGSDFRTTGGDYLTSGDRQTDLARARELLEAAGYPGGKGLKLELLYNTATSHTRIAESLRDSLKADLGIEVKLVGQDWRTYLQTRDRGKFDLARTGWIADYAHPLSFLETMTSASRNNVSGWANADFDVRIAAAKASQDPAVVFAALHEAEAILMEEAPLIPLYFYGNPNVYRPWVQGVVVSALGPIDFKSAWVEEH